MLLQRDRRPLWKVEMVNLNPLLLLGAGSAARMADNKHLLKGFFISSVLILIRTTHLLTLPTFPWRKGEMCAGDTVSVGLRLLLYAEVFATMEGIFSAGAGGGTIRRSLQRCLLLTHAKLF